MEDVSKIAQEKISEIESYYGKSLTEIVMMFTKEPIVRHFKGSYYRVVSINKDCDSEALYVSYTPLNGGRNGLGWTRELLDFLSPVDAGREDNILHQDRRFVFVDGFESQLDLVSTEDIVAELNKRSKDTRYLSKSDILANDFVVARVVNDYVRDIFAIASTREEAEDCLSKNKRRNKLTSTDIIVAERIFLR